MIKLYGYQYDALEFHLARKYSINAFTMGLGKTVLALRFMDECDGRALIIAPKFLLKNWRDEITKFGISIPFSLVSYSTLHNLEDYDFDTVIADEAHYIKNPKSRRAMALKYLLNRGKPEYFLQLTATPAKNDISEVYNLLALADIGHKLPEFSPFKDIWRFKRYFMNERTQKMRGRIIRKYEGMRNDKLFTDLLQHFIYRKSSHEVILPSESHNVIDLNYLKYDKELESLIKEYDDKVYMTLKAEVAEKSVPFTVKFLGGMSNLDQAIIFTDHVKSAKALGKELECPAIHGDTSVEDRNTIIEAFKQGNCRFLVATYKTAGIGLTLTNCNYMVFNDLPFVPADIVQARGRIRRIGQKKPCFYYYMSLSKMHTKLFKMLKKKSEHLRVLK